MRSGSPRPGGPIDHEPLRVLYVISSVAGVHGGPSTVALETARELRRHGLVVDVLTTDAGLSRTERSARQAEGVTVCREFPRSKLRMSAGLLAVLVRRLRHYDVLHVHGDWQLPGLMAGLLASRCQVPYVVQPHGSWEAYQQRSSSRLKQAYDVAGGGRARSGARAHVFTTTSEVSAAHVQRSAVPEVVIPLGTDVSEAQRCIPVLRSPTTEVVTFFGRISHVKRVDLLLDAWQLVRQARPEAELHVVGPDSEGLWAALQEGRPRQDFQGVSRMGLVTGTDKWDVLSRSTLFVLPSENENFGIAAIEALAVGVPVLSSPHVGVGHEISGLGGGRTFPHLTASSLASELIEWLSELASDPAGAQAARERARAVAVQHFSLTATIARLRALYEDITSEPQTP